MFNKYHLLQNGYKLILLCSLLTAVLILSGCGAQAAPKTYRVGILSGLDVFATTADGFKAKMADLGYVEGQNIVYDVQKTNADPVEVQRVVKKFVADKVDLIFAFPTDPAAAAKAATQGTNIPVVFANAGIEGSNLVESVRLPGGNITGVRFPSSELTLKRLDFLHKIVPQAKRIYVTYDSTYPGISFTLDMLRKEAPSMNVTLIEVPVTNLEELKADLDTRSKSNDIGIDAILIMPTLLTASPEGFEVMHKFAVEHKLAVAGSTNNNADMGAIFSYIPENVDMGKLAAPLADKVLKGIPAGTIPVVSPEARLRINYKVAQELGLTVPEGLLSQADEIIR